MSLTKEIDYPLSNKTYNHEEINAMIDVLKNDKLTMGEKVKEFEQNFAKYVNAKYAVFVNSGSSANLLALSCITNFRFNNHLKCGDKIIVPTVCWSTSVWPILQNNLVPVFVDINQNTLNADIDKIQELLETDSSIKAIMAVHILGNSTNMNRLMELKEKHNLLLIEDTCESLGSTYNNKFLGTFGECGTFSFYFSHHITTIEGGMIVCNDYKIYNILKCLRAHGWTRDVDLSLYEDCKDITANDRFCFINLGYNLRPMETQAAMGIIQLTKLSVQNENRVKNYNRIKACIESYQSDKLSFFTAEENCNCIWFSLPLLLNKKYDKTQYMKRLFDKGIDSRPIVTGNFTNQPVFKYLNIPGTQDSAYYKNSENIDKHGFFIGLHAYEMKKNEIEILVSILLES